MVQGATGELTEPGKDIVWRGGNKILVQHRRASRYGSVLMLFYTQIAVLESREPSVVEGTSGQDLGAEEKLSSQDSVTNTQSTDSLLGKKAYTL